MKVAIVLMKGFDGCGVSRFAIEHQKELRKTGNICDVYSFNNKYARTIAHKDRDVIFYDNFTDVDFSSYDIFVLNSYEKDFNEEDLNYYKSLKCKKVAMMHEILRQNIGRIDHVWDWIEASDVVSSFSLEMDFTHDLFEKYPDKNYFSFKMCTSEDEMNSMYNSSLNNERDNILIYFGRWTTMKDPHRLFDYKKLDPEFKVAGIGLERSIGAFHDIFNQEKCQAIKLNFLNSKEEFDNADKDFSMVPIFPPVARDAAMDIIGHSLYGASFYRLNGPRAHNLGNRMEFAQIELSCVCLPVFDKFWGQNTFDKVTEKSFYEIGNNAIFSDVDNLQESLDEMKYLANHPDEYATRRKNIFDLVKRNYSSTNNIKEFYDNIINNNFEKIVKNNSKNNFACNDILCNLWDF